MRITNNTLMKNYLKNVSRNLGNMQKVQNQMSTGKEISKSSDDPMTFSTITRLKNSINENQQYKGSINSSMSWIDTADASLSSVTDTMQNIRGLVVRGASNTMTDSDRGTLADQVEALTEEITQCLNTNYDGRQMFGGQKTTEKPFRINNEGEMVYSGDTNNIIREISPGVNITIITDGSKISTADTSDPNNEILGKLLVNIKDALKNGDTDALSGALLKDIDTHIENITGIRSKMGAIYNRLDAAGQRNESENLNLTKLLSESEDADLAEKTLQFATMNTVYEASLQTGAKILQPSLLDYL